jgi:hypothetical protein
MTGFFTAHILNLLSLSIVETHQEYATFLEPPSYLAGKIYQRHSAMNHTDCILRDHQLLHYHSDDLNYAALTAERREQAL